MSMTLIINIIILGLIHKTASTEIKSLNTNCELITKQNITINCKYNSTYTLEYDIWSKYNLFCKIISRKRYNTNILDFSQYENDKFKKLKKITSGELMVIETLKDFIEVLTLLLFFDIKDEYKLDIFQNIFALRLKEDVIFEIEKHYTKFKDNDKSIYRRLDISLCCLFLRELRDRFSLCITPIHTTIEISTKDNTRNRDIHKIDLSNVEKVQVKAAILNKNSVKNDLLGFGKIFRCVSNELFSNEKNGAKINNLTIYGNITPKKIGIFKKIIGAKNSKISTITLESVVRDFKGNFFQRKNDFGKFFKKFKSLQKIELVILNAIDEKDVCKLLKLEKLKNKLYKFVIQRVKISSEAARLIAENKCLEYFALKDCQITLKDLQSILESKELQNRLKSLCFEKISNVNVQLATEISRFRRLKTLKFVNCKINEDTLSTILQGNAKDTVKKLTITGSIIIKDHLEHISGFRNLERLDLSDLNFPNADFTNLFKNDFIRTNLKKFNLNFKYHDVDIDNYLSCVLNFNNLEELYLDCERINKDKLTSILDNAYWKVSIKKLTLSKPIIFDENHANLFSNFSSLKELEIFNPDKHIMMNITRLIRNENIRSSLVSLKICGSRVIIDRDLARIISECVNLITLDLSHCTINFEELKTILKSEYLQKNIKELLLRNLKGFYDVHAKIISDFQTLEVLDVRTSTLPTGVLKILFESPRLQNSIQELYFYYNNDFKANRNSLLNFVAMEKYGPQDK